MRALRFDPAGLRLDPNSPEPVAGPGEALIRPTRIAIGDADLAAMSGRAGFSGIPGHEFTGIVERVNPGPGRDDHQRWQGKRVVGSINIVCGKCDLCRAGLSNHCRTRRVLGLVGKDGCFAERFTLPIANLVEVPRSIDDDRAVFAEPLAAAAHAAQLVRIEGKPYITVLGDNAAGLLVAQLMAKLNASVRVLGDSPGKFTLCEKWGVKHRHADEAGRRQDQDVVIDCTGTAAGLLLATQMVRPRGKIILKTEPAVEGARTGMEYGPALDAIVVNELEVIGSRCGRMADAVDLMVSGSVDVLSLMTARMKFADAVEAVKKARQPEQIKVVMEV
ncbi:MAG: alcohol dehydrogenase catalytic domain-containing protein [Phycisphaerales bacterium]|nr:alcohol dehydrogenase catalytic domain-containing protein [Phycisphaerales bacterium]